MNAIFYGYKELNFKTRDGRTISGLSGFFGFREIGIVGLKCEKFFIPASVQVPKEAVGKEVKLSFNHKGRVESVEEIKK